MVQVVILAGGEGKRMGSSTPKVLHKVGGIFMIERVIMKAVSLNPSQIIVVSGKNTDVFMEALSHIKYPIKYIPQIDPQGTGHAVKMTLPYLNDDPVLIINADTPLIDTCLDEMLIFPTPCIMMTRLKNPFGQGRIITDSDGKFQCIVEEKDANDEQKNVNLVNSGIYLVDSRDLQTYIPLLNNQNAQNEYYLTDVLSHLAPKVQLYELPEKKQYQLLNVNTQEELAQANTVLKSK
jgi:bifunctional UDP-N-acetylglucosamine pyrophosphorylase/glucosamine-1-phosphate N-acetyltransferase